MNSPMSSEESQVSKSSKTMFSSDSSFKQASDDDSSADNVLSFIRKGSKQISSRKSISRESKLNVSISKASDTSFETVSISDHFGPHFNVQDEKKLYIRLMEIEEKSANGVNVTSLNDQKYKLMYAYLQQMKKVNRIQMLIKEAPKSQLKDLKLQLQQLKIECFHGNNCVKGFPKSQWKYCFVLTHSNDGVEGIFKLKKGAYSKYIDPDTIVSHDDLIGRAYSVSESFDVLLNHYLRIASDPKKERFKLWEKTLELRRIMKGYPTITEKMVNTFAGIIKKYVEKEDSIDPNKLPADSSSDDSFQQISSVSPIPHEVVIEGSLNGIEIDTMNREPTASCAKIESSSNAVIGETPTHLLVAGGIWGFPDICDIINYIFVMDVNSEYIHMVRKIDDLSIETIAYELSLIFVSIKFYQGIISLKYDGKAFDLKRYLLQTIPLTNGQTIKVMNYDLFSVEKEPIYDEMSFVPLELSGQAVSNNSSIVSLMFSIYNVNFCSLH